MVASEAAVTSASTEEPSTETMDLYDADQADQADNGPVNVPSKNEASATPHETDTDGAGPA